MPKVDLNRVVQIALGLATLGLIAALVIGLVQSSRTQHITLAAGSSTGESYILGQALKTVVERHYPGIRVTLLETGGTVENLAMLDDNRAQIVTAQSDVLPGPRARAVAVLYNDEFQLLVPQNSPLKSFIDLRGRRIALAQKGGQFQSFLAVADHFGLARQDFQFVGGSDKEADQAFLSGAADAIFRVRAIGNPTVQHFVQSGKARFLPIEHAAAMKIKYPAFEPTTIPEGAYWGNPPIPAQDLPTVAVPRILLARDTANVEAVRAVTQVLFERRQEVMEEIPAQMPEVRLLLVQVHRPLDRAGLGSALHPGAIGFYDKDKPSFLLAHADYVGLMLTVVLMVSSWIWELKQWVHKQQKNAADIYGNRVVALMNAVDQADSLPRIDEIWRDLVKLLAEAVSDLDNDKLSEESFNSFRAILQIGMDVAKERRAALRAAPSTAGA